MDLTLKCFTLLLVVACGVQGRTLEGLDQGQDTIHPLHITKRDVMDDTLPLDSSSSRSFDDFNVDSDIFDKRGNKLNRMPAYFGKRSKLTRMPISFGKRSILNRMSNAFGKRSRLSRMPSVFGKRSSYFGDIEDDNAPSDENLPTYDFFKSDSNSPSFPNSDQELTNDIYMVVP